MMLHGLKQIGLIFCLITGAVNAAPTAKKYGEGRHRGNAAIESTLAEGFSQCNLAGVSVPLCPSGTTCLTPPPQKTSTVVAVALGVGTQNYTCASPNAVPVANGAIATLYDVSCTAVYNSASTHLLAPLVIKAGVQKVQDATSTTAPIPLGLGYPKIGTHYFAPNAQTPVFELESNGTTKSKKKFVGARLEGIAAPPTALAGTVDWLKLGRSSGKESESNGVQFVYRVYTAGGKPPATCADVAKAGGEIIVEYATEYWFYD
ncbi:hypothetical protein DFH27DRAFT_571661 [Peziza echinospora]|nr:hypothetical protein DFH27DRAFT_571661 [Peziza echinospora]